MIEKSSAHISKREMIDILLYIKEQQKDIQVYNHHPQNA